MTRNKDKFIKLDKSIRRPIRFVYISKVTYEGMKNTFVKRKFVQE